METKKCRKCFETKEIFEFRKVKDRYRNECKECYNLYNRDYNKSEKRKEYLKSEKRREYTKEYMKIYEKCDKRKGYWKMYECTKERKEYRTKYNRFYRKKRKEEDPLFRLSISIRNRISESIYRMGYTKNSKTYKILGCDFKDFKFYIESKFVDNMSWDNYGKAIS